ncbi:MAG: hypothetical protein IIZ50_01265, partial [Bifidobacterium sp.]|nr:hypothetical protein [Bifidobacterium sp.]
GNSDKDEHKQAQVVRDIAARIAQGERGVTGIMMESFLEGGNQPAAPLRMTAPYNYTRMTMSNCPPNSSFNAARRRA